MKPAQGRTDADVTAPLRQMTAKHAKFRWTEQCEESFKELKQLLMSDKARKTRVYCDDGPLGLGATVAQEYRVEGLDHPILRPVTYTGRAKTEAELQYGKVDRESLGVLTGMKCTCTGPSSRWWWTTCPWCHVQVPFQGPASQGVIAQVQAQGIRLRRGV